MTKAEVWNFCYSTFENLLATCFFSDFLDSRIHWMKKINKTEQRLVSVKFQNLKNKQ